MNSAAKTSRDFRLANCARVSRAMRGSRTIFEHTTEWFGGGITYALWLKPDSDMTLSVADAKMISYYRVTEAIDAK